MTTAMWVLGIAVVAGLSLAVGAHALMYKRDPRSQLVWILSIFFLPVLGAVAYWIFGVNRIRRRALRKRSTQLPGSEGPTEQERDRVRQVVLASGMGDFAFLVDRIARRPLVAGNAVEPLHNGEGAYPLMLEQIARAERSVTLCTYIFDGDDTGRAFADALHAASRRGVEVRVLVDAIGERYSTVSIFRWLTGLPAARFNPMRFSGRAAAYLNLRLHRKALVVDGQVGFTGGMNIGDRHLAARTDNEERVVDMHFRVVGPVVAQIQEAFAEDWYFTTGETLEGATWFSPLSDQGPAVARVISDGPDEDFEKLQWILMGALSCARRRVLVMTPYFIPNRALIGALGTAALRGVEVTVILPAKNNLRFVQWATNAYLWELLTHEVRIFFQPPPFVHTKLLVVDDAWCLVGSSNLDPRSLRLNFELNLEVYDRGLAGALAAHVADTLARSHEVTIEEVNAQPPAQRLRDAVAKLFSPYL